MNKIPLPLTKRDLDDMKRHAKKIEDPFQRRMVTHLLWEVWRLRQLALRFGQFAMSHPEMFQVGLGNAALGEMTHEPIVMHHYPEIRDMFYNASRLPPSPEGEEKQCNTPYPHPRTEVTPQPAYAPPDVSSDVLDPTRDQPCATTTDPAAGKISSPFME